MLGGIEREKRKTGTSAGVTSPLIVHFFLPLPSAFSLDIVPSYTCLTPDTCHLSHVQAGEDVVALSVTPLPPLPSQELLRRASSLLVAKAARFESCPRHSFIFGPRSDVALSLRDLVLRSVSLTLSISALRSCQFSRRRSPDSIPAAAGRDIRRDILYEEFAPYFASS